MSFALLKASHSVFNAPRSQDVLLYAEVITLYDPAFGRQIPCEYANKVCQYWVLWTGQLLLGWNLEMISLCPCLRSVNVLEPLVRGTGWTLENLSTRLL